MHLHPSIKLEAGVFGRVGVGKAAPEAPIVTSEPGRGPDEDGLQLEEVLQAVPQLHPDAPRLGKCGTEQEG